MNTTYNFTRRTNNSGHINIPRDFTGPRINNANVPRRFNISTGLRNSNLPLEKKYNPDVEHNYNKINKLRDQDINSYTFKKQRYKTIINDVPLPTLNRNDKFAQKKLEIHVKHDKTQSKINNNLRKLKNERMYTDREKKLKFSKEKRNEFEKKFKFKNVDYFKKKLENYEFNDHGDKKSNSIEYYKRAQNKLDKHKQDMNEIVNFISNMNFGHN